MKPPLLEALGIRKSFDNVVVLSDVDFRLERGEVHAIVGQNGAGKSTLMKILNGVYAKDAGEIRIDGEVRAYDSRAGAARNGISMVFQDFSLVPSMKVYQNIFLSRSVAGAEGVFLDERRMKEKARNLLAGIGVDVDIDVDDLVGDISVGSRQVVEIAKALSMESRILIFDEPTASLSTAETARLFETVSRLKARGVSIVYITHYLRDVFRICDSVTVLRDGKAVMAERIPDTTLDRVIQAMTGKAAAAGRAERASVPPGAPEALRLESVTTDKVRGVSFSLRKGEILGLAGLLGSGRTEILRALYGLDRIRSGAVSVDGRKITLKSTRDARNGGIALVPEDRRTQGLITGFTLYENILVGLLATVSRNFFIDRAKTAAAAKSFIAKFGIKAGGMDDGVRFLSGGNQQKVVIAKNIAVNPLVLLLDDPTFGIDIQSKAEIMEIVRNYVAEGHAAILVSSEFNELIALCDRILMVKKGEISGEIEVDRERTTEEEIIHLAQ